MVKTDELSRMHALALNLNGGNLEDQLFPKKTVKATLTHDVKPQHITFMDEINTINTRPNKLKTNPEEEIKIINGNIIKRHMDQRKVQVRDVVNRFIHKRTKMRKEDSPVRHKTTSNSLAKYICGQRIDQEIYEKLPQYYHKAVDKYLNLQINGSIDSYSIHSRNGKKCSGSSKSFRNLPLIRKTGQGIMEKPTVTTDLHESRSTQNCWTKKTKQVKMRPQDVINQIVSRTKRIQDTRDEVSNSHFLNSKEANKFLKKKEEDLIKEKEKFNTIGNAYKAEFTRFQFKVDSIVNDAYLYVKDLQTP